MQSGFYWSSAGRKFAGDELLNPSQTLRLSLGRFPFSYL